MVLSFPWWKAIGIILFSLLLLGFNFLLLKKLEDLQDYSGGNETATSGFWATLDGKFYINATKSQTGEWTPPLGSFIKFLLVKAIIIGATLYLTSILAFKWGILIYAGLLILVNGLIFVVGIVRS